MSNNRESILAVILLFNSFTWYYFTLLSAETFLSNLVFHLGIIGFSIFGSILSTKTNRVRFIYVWIILGTITSLLPGLINNGTQYILAYFVLGACLGIGMPSCLAYFADYTSISKRGSLGGVIFLTTNLGIFIVATFLNNLITNFFFLFVWRIFGLAVLLLVHPVESADAKKGDVSFIVVLRERPYILYFITWLVFCVTESGASIDFGQTSNLMWIAIFGSLASLFSGIFSDRNGRKRVILFALITLGTAYAIRGLFPNSAITQYLYLTCSGITWGTFSVVFISVLWGDLSHSRKQREKYYALGILPFFLFALFRLILVQYITLVPTASVYSLASFSLFLAVMPIIFAPETLPERKIELRRLKKYIEAAKKVHEKYG